MWVCREQWLECCRRAFGGLERDSAGRVTSTSLLEGLRSRLPAAEIEYAVEDALIEAGYAGIYLAALAWLTHLALASLNQ